jgi:hypothetical protein
MKLHSNGMSKRSSLKCTWALLILLACIIADTSAQTFFETAEDDGIISFSTNRVSQLKLNMSSTAISYGFNYLAGDATDKKRFIINVQVKAKPNDNGMAVLLKTGNLQPGLIINSAIGGRIRDVLPGFFNAFDLYVKPTFALNGFTMYDSLRGVSGEDPVYKATKGTFGANLLLNGVLSPGSVNFFFGIQYGSYWTSNGDNLPDGSVQIVTPYAGSSTKYLFRDAVEVKYGQLESVTKNPFKVDLIFDPALKLNDKDKTNIRLGFFGYYRTDGMEKKYRSGFGICFLDATDPSRIFSSLGYELPAFGEDVTEKAKMEDKGQVFFTIGYSIF